MINAVKGVWKRSVAQNESLPGVSMFAIRAQTFRYAVRRSPRSYSVRLLVSIIAIDAACELVHVAARKMRLKSFAEVVVPISLLRRDSHDESLSGCCHHVRFGHPWRNGRKQRSSFTTLFAVDRGQRSAVRSTCSTWMSDPLITTSFRTLGARYGNKLPGTFFFGRG